MTSVKKYRVESIDLLKGLVMVIMALDHVRDYFHYSANFYDPADPTQTTLPIFFTRWITHFCAPAFSFLAGLSAYMVGKKKSRKELSRFLVQRGLWLVFIELTIVTFGWYFDIHFRTISLLVIWSLGVSMITLAALIYLPKNLLLIFCCLLFFGHNLLDKVQFNNNLLWEILHQQNFYKLSDSTQLFVGYPIIPWIAVMALGYYFGQFYNQTYTASNRKRIFNIVGFSALALFVILRWTNSYGNPVPRQQYDSLSKDVVSFLNPAKYPPSLMFLLMTLGTTLVFLANSEKLRGRLVNFFSTFGRVPFFYYILHIYLIHVLAMIFAELSGFGWKLFILPTWIGFVPAMKGYGFNLVTVYFVWIGIILALYPLCRKFDHYKQNNKHKWWLSYL